MKEFIVSNSQERCETENHTTQTRFNCTSDERTATLSLEKQKADNNYTNTYQKINIMSSTKSALEDILSSLNLPPGLLSSVYQTYQHCDSRIWLLDNSARMNVRDSHVSRPGNQLPDSIQRIDDMMRWEELEECVRYHTSMASQLWLPSTYYLMDDGEEEWQLSRGYTLCHGKVEDVPLEVKDLYYRLENVELDQSRCPLRYCIHSLAKDIKAGAQAISARDRHVTVIICSQGRPTTRDGDTGSKIMKDFQDELELLSKLPVKIIVRLCTDTEEVRDMYNSMDSRFDCIDVLDDFWGTFPSFFYICVWDDF